MTPEQAQSLLTLTSSFEETRTKLAETLHATNYPPNLIGATILISTGVACMRMLRLPENEIKTIVSLAIKVTATRPEPQEKTPNDI